MGKGREVTAASTIEEVLAWIANTDERHAKVDDLTCACGWVGFGAITWDQHRPHYPLGDLSDIIPSATLGGAGGHMTCSKAEEWVYRCLDNAHEQNDRLLEALEAIAEDRVPGDIREFARNALNAERPT